MKKIFISMLLMGFVLTAGAQARVHIGMNLGRPGLGYRQPFMMTYAPVNGFAPPRMGCVRPRMGRKIVVVPSPRRRW